MNCNLRFRPFDVFSQSYKINYEKIADNIYLILDFKWFSITYLIEIEQINYNNFFYWKWYDEKLIILIKTTWWI